ncbi:cytochrome P450 [Thelephora ganbajun]|uniref:Cytochrome P450 n=1 Tax=Thelephora ganbajun TaxID=370292 RepID=A0ACB6ZUP5_THEGA|nr:cytochrome P450 [Thelephora ganbajun]
MVDFLDISVVGFAAFLIYALKTSFAARAVWKKFGAVPGRRTLFSEFSMLGNLTREVKYVTPGGDKCWREKHNEYKLHGWDAITSISLWPTPRAGFLVSDAHVIKIIFSSRLRFPKPVQDYKILKFFGNNIVTTEFDEWKRYRRIAAPAFGEKNNKLAFEESVRAIASLYEGRWRDKQKIVVDEALHLTLEAALMTISAAGFGHQINWEDDEASPGHKLSFKQSVEVVGTGVFIRVLCPKWIFEWAPIKKIREVRDGFAEFRSYLVEMINERKLSDERDEKRDLLSNLISANEEFMDDGEQKLGEVELIGNIFIFYIAGHETSGHTLCFALNMLAVHQEEQEALYQHIRDVLPDGRPPTYEDIPRLNRVTAALYETLRMFPPAPVVPKYSAEDTSLVVGNQAGETTVFPIPAGGKINIDVVGLHYNPRYWEDPSAFKPERFMGEYNKDAFVPFAWGARACIGRGFFETTGLAMLTTLIQRYRVEPHPKFAGESFDRLKERYSQAKGMLILTPLLSSLVFKRRK